MKVLIASDSFKGSLRSMEVALIMKEAILKVDPTYEVFCLPMADGGENSLECALSLDKAQVIHVEVRGPYGQKVKAKYVKIQELAFIEMAQASGLMLDVKKIQNPMLANTYGVGELILDALNRNCHEFIICLGGSATNDGGCGMIQALGGRFLCHDKEIKAIPIELANCDRIDLSHIDSRIQNCTFTLACDVNNPLLGEKGASYVFGSQKGASSKDIQQLDWILSHIADLLEKEVNRKCRNLAGAGAAGGLGFGLMCLCNANKQSGIETMLDLTDFDELVQKVDLVITGEGYSDAQSVFGKTPIGVAKRAKKYHKPVILISGAMDLIDFSEFGIDAQFSCVRKCCHVEEAIAHAKDNLYETTYQIFKMIQLIKNSA